MKLSGVFISYSRGDAYSKELADLLWAALDGHSPFLDSRNIATGEPWATKVYAALFDARAAVVLVSKTTLARPDWVAHETAILLGRQRRWRDTTIIPVLVGGITPEDIGRDPAFRALGALQLLSVDTASAEASAVTIRERLLALAADLRRRFFRTHLVTSLIKAPQRARAFDAHIRRLLAEDDDVSILAAIRATTLPVPPERENVDLQGYVVGLLLTVERPALLLQHLKSRRALERYLGRRGLAPTDDPFGRSPILRATWSFRVAAVWALALSAAVAWLFVGYANSLDTIPAKPGELLRSFALSAPAVFTIALVFVVTYRWVWFLRRGE